MKNLLTFYCIFCISSVVAQTQTNTIIWNWENNPTMEKFTEECCGLAGGAYVSGVQIPWYGTHGCVGGCTCAEGERQHILLFVPNTGNPSGRGFAIQYNFKAGYRYTISIDGAIEDVLAWGEQRPYRPPTMQVGFTNTIDIQNNLCSGVGIPSVDISSLTSPMATFTNAAYVVSMDLNECKQYLWFSARSNPSGGNSGAIRIRKLTITEEPITPITMSGNSVVCGNSQTYTLSSIPPGATVNWTLHGVDANGYQLPMQNVCNLAQNGSQATLTKITNGTVRLMATITNCGGTPLVIQKIVTFGVPEIYAYAAYNPNTVYMPLEGTATVTESSLNYVTLESSGNNNYVWEYGSGTSNGWYEFGLTGPYFAYLGWYTPLNYNDYIGFSIHTSNVCGTRTDQMYFYYQGPMQFYRVAPNPVNSTFTIRQADLKRNTAPVGKKLLNVDLLRVQIANNVGQVVMERVYPAKTISATIDVSGLRSGVYTVRLFTESKPESHKIIVRH